VNWVIAAAAAEQQLRGNCENFGHRDGTAKTTSLGLYEMHLFSDSPNLCQRTTVLNAGSKLLHNAVIISHSKLCNSKQNYGLFSRIISLHNSSIQIVRIYARICVNRRYGQ